MSKVQALVAGAVLALGLLAERSGASQEELPKWELGVGFGYLSLEHYPSADQFTQLMLPFPTFQYRGSIFRADDREKARLYVLKRPSWHLQVGGFALPPLVSSTNGARQGMDDLPLFGAIGPQLHKTLSTDHAMSELSVKAAVYHGIATNLSFFHPKGAVWELNLSYRRDVVLWGHASSSTVSIGIQGASQEVHDLYFRVPSEDATSTRPAFEPRAGFLQSQLSWFQSFKRGGFALYAGVRISDHRWSANRDSPLHKADQNVVGLVGITHDLYRSRQTGVSDEKASGLVDKLRERERQR